MPTSTANSTPLWQAAPAPDAEALEAVLAYCNLHPAVARIVARRIPSIDAIPMWLNPVDKTLSPYCDPYQVHDLKRAVERLREAITNQESILVFGDYDTDGITATTLMNHALKECKAKVEWFIPDRETEGYGLTPKALERCLHEHPNTQLLVTVDCGISCVAEITELNQLGITVIVTDHHVPPETLPPAYALVNPRLGAPKGAENMCGCATAHTLIRALFEHFPGATHQFYLDLVAIATIADVMPLTGENRSLVAKGISLLGGKWKNNPGLRALIEAQKLDFASLTAEQLAFKLIPCVNAASRIGECNRACNLILREPIRWQDATSDAIRLQCREAAKDLIAANQKRREIENKLREVIDAQAIRPHDNLILAAGSREEGFHPGVLGIVAARLSEEFGLPAAVCCLKADGSGCGSIRSRGAWHAVQALDSVSDLLEHYGGHAAAAGFSFKPGQFEAFRERFAQAFAQISPTDEPILYDEALTCEVDNDLMTSLEKLEPFGTGNPKPVFAKTFILNTFRAIGTDKTHLSLTLRDPERTTAGFTRAIWFGAAHRASSWLPNQRLRLLFTVGRDAYAQNQLSLQIIDAITLDA